MIDQFLTTRRLLTAVFALSIVPFAQKATSDIIFSDNFDTDPAANGWTESPGAGAIIELATGDPQLADGTAAVIYRGDGSSSESLSSISRTISTEGYDNIGLELVAFQHGGSYEGSELLKIEYRLADDQPYQSLLRDVEVYNAVEDNIGEMTSGADGNTTPTSTGVLLLPEEAANNAELNIRILVNTGNNPGFNSAAEAYYLDRFELTGTVPEPSSLTLAAGSIALLCRRRSRA